MLLSHGERHARWFYRTWATGLLPAKYLIWFVIYLAATALSVGRPFLFLLGANCTALCATVNGTGHLCELVYDIVIRIAST